MPKLNNFIFDEENLDIAYLLGLYLTDGYVTPNCKYFRLRCTDRDLCENVRQIALSLFGNSLEVKDHSKYYPKAKKDVYEVMIRSETLCEWLVSQTTTKKYLPSWIYTTSLEWKKSFIAGCIDGDGYISVNQRRYKNNPTDALAWCSTIGLCGEKGMYIDGMHKLFDSIGLEYSYSDTPPKRENETATMRNFNILPHSFVSNEMYVKCERKLKNLNTIKEYKIGYKHCVRGINRRRGSESKDVTLDNSDDMFRTSMKVDENHRNDDSVK